MGKFVQLSSSSSSKQSFQLKKHKKNVVQVDQCDLISKLPDELLCSIISLLTFTEAARTSVLAHRWKSLWYSFHGTFDIDAPNKILIFSDDTSDDKMEQTMFDYVSSMSQTLPLLSSPLLDAFIVRFSNKNDVCASHLDLCVQFAIKKRIKRFELDTRPKPISFGRRALYNFPVEFYAWIKNPCGLGSVSPLTSISLNHVNVSQDLIQHLLVNCPFLESLRVRDAYELLNPKFIGGSTLKLKYLEVLGRNLESIEICTPNLLAFVTNGLKVKLHIKDAPKLVELSIAVDVINYRPESVTSHLPHLESLTLELGTKLMHQFDQLSRLQHLTWELGVYLDEHTVNLNNLMEASPLLNKFTLVIFLNVHKAKKILSTVTAKDPHQCLKVVEIDGFTGGDAEINLVKYFVENTTSLKEIILDIRSPLFRGTPWTSRPSHLRRSKLCALKLKKYVPPRISLVILE